MAERKDRFALISRFEKLCRMNDIEVAAINKYNEQWASDALLESFSVQELHDAMDYYFKINPRPIWKGFANNVDRLLQSIKLQAEDDIFRMKMRQKAKEWLGES